MCSADRLRPIFPSGVAFPRAPESESSPHSHSISALLFDLQKLCTAFVALRPRHRILSPWGQNSAEGAFVHIRCTKEKERPTCAGRSLWTEKDATVYFMMRDSEPGNAQVGASFRSALIWLANCVGALTLDDVTC
jgi:hypothetical protein